jgi:beta-galactosidase
LFRRYRKTFTHTPSHLVPNERVAVQFDGVYMNSDMYINDVFLGNHPYGYTQINYDITPHLKAGKNVLAVRIRDLGRNSRWYSGSGIFRHVHLITTPELHIGLWGIVTRTAVAADKSSAAVSVSVLCENNGTATVAKGGLTATILDAEGKTVATGTADLPAVAAGAAATVNITGIVVKSPTLWESVPNGGTGTHSYMYSVKVELTSAKGGMRGATTDTEVLAFS